MVPSPTLAPTATPWPTDPRWRWSPTARWRRGEIQVATRFVDPGARSRSGQGSGGGSGPAAAGDAAWGEVIAEEDGAPAGHGAAEPVGGGLAAPS